MAKIREEGRDRILCLANKGTTPFGRHPLTHARRQKHDPRRGCACGRVGRGGGVLLGKKGGEGDLKKRREKHRQTVPKSSHPGRACVCVCVCAYV